ncbi:MAG: hypothetical protein ACI9LU_002021 [Polaribacter sp.]|jgi:hypothetical protein
MAGLKWQALVRVRPAGPDAMNGLFLRLDNLDSTYFCYYFDLR